MASLKELEKKAKQAELAEDAELAHSFYSMLAYNCRKAKSWTKAAFYNLKAGIYAPSNPDDYAAGYEAIEDLEDDE